MGLLDETSAFMKSPEGQGLLSAVAGGMAGARKGQPWNTAGIAGLSGLKGYSNAVEQGVQIEDRKIAQQYRGAQMQQIQEAMRLKQKQEAALQAAPEDVRNAVAMGVPYADVWKHQNPADNKPQLVTVQTPQGPMQRWLKPGETAGADVGAPIDKEAALPWYARKGPDGRIAIDPAFAELEKTKASFGRPPAMPMAPVAYVDEKGNTVWGTITEAKGRPAANYSPEIKGGIARAVVAGKGKGEADVTLSASESTLPQLDETVKELKTLGQKATYTLVGQGRDAAVRQLGMGATEGAVAREKYTMTVRDVLFPQLRATFGAQFTVKEGEALVATLGDPNKSPQEKNAALDAFIDQKKQTIQSLQRQTGKPDAAPADLQAAAAAELARRRGGK